MQYVISHSPDNLLNKAQGSWRRFVSSQLVFTRLRFNDSYVSRVHEMSDARIFLENRAGLHISDMHLILLSEICVGIILRPSRLLEILIMKPLIHHRGPCVWSLFISLFYCHTFHIAGLSRWMVFRSIFMCSSATARSWDANELI